MQVRNFTQEEILNLPCICGATSEGDIILNDDKVIKMIRSTSGSYFSNKLFTIHALLDSIDLPKIEELVLPEKLVTVDDKVIGFTMPFKDGITLEEYLDSNVSINLKIEALKKVGKILDKMKKLREDKMMPDFFLNDLHERNFLVDPKTGKVHVVDLDSCSINGNLKFGSKYLSYLTPLDGFKKYEKVNLFSCGADYVPSENTDLYCYAIMVLNFLSGINFHRLSLDDAYQYFSFLKNLGVDKHFVDNVSKIYSENDNVNIGNYLDSLKNFVGKSRLRIK